MGVVKGGLAGLLVALSLGGALATVSTTAQAKPQPVQATVTEVNGKKVVMYNGKQYTLKQGVELGLTSDSSVKAKENRWTYKLTNVKAKRTKSGKSVKVSGKLTVTNIPLSVFTPAKNVQIVTANGVKLAKVTKQLTFSQVVKTKAKKLTLRAGYNGKVNGHQSFFVLSANKHFKVKAYK